MKKQNSKLFAKFEDAKILAETAKKVSGGLMVATSKDTCTGFNGGSDCMDSDVKDGSDWKSTKAYYDSSC